MPEYLAPGVYVEETSFRSKSIEGVSTSTTAFVGPTARGPIFDPRRPDVNAIPEMLTSFADFERVYGGLDELRIGSDRTNYIAHAVRAYFDNGGARLYVSRAFQRNGSDGHARSRPLADLAVDADETVFIARSPGQAGEGQLVLRQEEAPATVLSLNTAQEGSMLRVGGSAGAATARILGGSSPFVALPNGGTMTLNVTPQGEAQQAVTITVRGRRTEVTGTALAAPVDVQAPDNVLVITVDGVPQRITLTTGAHTPQELINEINASLLGGRVRLTGTNQLAIASDRQGLAAEVVVTGNPTLGFTPTAPATTIASHGTDDPANNNVGDLMRVSADEINALLAAQSDEVRAAFDPSVNRLVLATFDEGAAVTLAVADDANDANDAVALALGLTPGTSVTGSGAGAPAYYVKQTGTWLDSDGTQLDLSTVTVGADGVVGDLLTISVTALDRAGNQIGYEGLGFSSLHPRWIGHVLAEQPKSRAEALEGTYAIKWGAASVDAFELRRSLFSTGEHRTITVTGGNDGLEPGAEAYTNALRALEQLDDISIVAAPGHSARTEAQAISGAVVTHAEQRRSYRIAVLDTPPGITVGEARNFKAAIDSKYAALYYPWVIAPNPLARAGDDSIPREIPLPPSGFVCGIYARNDIERGVFKAPANEVVRGALRFQNDVNFAQQGLLNPLGVNCLRFFPGRGYRVWGARTASSDPEWKYVNIRRYFNYLERSIDVGTQWAVFEPNGERLWANIRETITSFLFNEWQSGALLGENPKQAFFVRCDRTTMNQYNIDNGQLICLVGVAAIKPAEFVIFRIGQKTADARA